jgi:hypothetical protein
MPNVQAVLSSACLSLGRRCSCHAFAAFTIGEVAGLTLSCQRLQLPFSEVTQGYADARRFSTGGRPDCRFKQQLKLPVIPS